MATPPLSVAYGVQEGMGLEGRREKCKKHMPGSLLPLIKKTALLETSSDIHWPELCHVITPAIRKSGKVNICNWAHGHPGGGGGEPEVL